MTEFRYEEQEPRRTRAILAAASLFLLCLVVYAALESERPIRYYGFFFIAGILALGFCRRAGRLLRPRVNGCRFDRERIRWQAGAEALEARWEEILRLTVLATGSNTALRLERRRGGSLRVPAYCLPAGDGELLSALRALVLPAHPDLSAWRNDERLGPAAEAAGTDEKTGAAPEV